VTAEPHWDITPEALVARNLVAAPLTGVCRRPTPLEPLAAAGHDLGVDLRVKREDLTDDFGSGHKARKLRYVLAEARRGQADVVVTAASLPSGQAAGLAAHAARSGLRAHIVYCGDRQRRPVDARGYYLLTALLGAAVTWHENGAWDRWPEFVDEVMASLREQGERPFLVPPGASAWPGLLGSVELGLELAEQLPRDGEPVHLVAAAGSGGTCLGLHLAARLLGLPWTVHGVSIAGSATEIEREMGRLAQDFRTRAGDLGAGAPLDHRGVRIYEGARGAGYDLVRPEELEVVRDVLARYGLLLDPTYLVKTFSGLRDLVKSRVIPAGSRVVLVHTGGGFGLFNDNAAVTEWTRRSLRAYLA
jgi:1-aminocyclopropane-1-carboxylate deaminase/D-cysteine desulfhydrase-like pyridoxal-dependent ACC family enzyme